MCVTGMSLSGSIKQIKQLEGLVFHQINKKSAYEPNGSENAAVTLNIHYKWVASFPAVLNHDGGLMYRLRQSAIRFLYSIITTGIGPLHRVH